MVTVDLKVRHFHEVNHVWGEDTSNMTTIPTQHLVSMHILKHWKPFQDLKLTFVVSCLPEKLRILTPRNIVDAEKDCLSSRQSSRIFRKRIRFHLSSSYHDLSESTPSTTHTIPVGPCHFSLVLEIRFTPFIDSCFFLSISSEPEVSSP